MKSVVIGLTAISLDSAVMEIYAYTSCNFGRRRKELSIIKDCSVDFPRRGKFLLYIVCSSYSNHLVSRRVILVCFEPNGEVIKSKDVRKMEEVICLFPENSEAIARIEELTEMITPMNLKLIS